MALFSLFQKAHKPGLDEDTLTVYGQLNLRNIVDVDDSKMIITVEITLRWTKR